MTTHRKPEHTKRSIILDQGFCSLNMPNRVARCSHGIELADDEDECVLCRLDNMLIRDAVIIR